MMVEMLKNFHPCPQAFSKTACSLLPSFFFDVGATEDDPDTSSSSTPADKVTSSKFENVLKYEIEKGLKYLQINEEFNLYQPEQIISKHEIDISLK